MLAWGGYGLPEEPEAYFTGKFRKQLLLEAVAGILVMIVPVVELRMRLGGRRRKADSPAALSGMQARTGLWRAGASGRTGAQGGT